MSHVKLREGTEVDAEAILCVHRRSILGLGINAYSAAECASWAAGLRRERYRMAMLSGGETYIVAEVGNNLVAFCSYKSDEIIGLYVDPASSRRGIGSLLLQKTEEQISTERPVSIKLNAALSALDFYEMQGYRTTNRKKWKTRGGLEIDVYEMKKDIS